MKTIKDSKIKRLNNEKGFILFMALIMICLVTIMGTTVSNTSSIEILMSGVAKEHRKAFYVSEAGADHVKGIFKSMFIQGNYAKIVSGHDPDWDFVLNGSQAGINMASGTDYEGGSIWINGGTFKGDYSYSVRVWNNADGGSATDDVDGVIYIRSVATGSHGLSTSIEVSVEGSVNRVESIAGHVERVGADSAKSYGSEDAEAVKDFTQQI